MHFESVCFHLREVYASDLLDILEMLYFRVVVNTRIRLMQLHKLVNLILHITGILQFQINVLARYGTLNPRSLILLHFPSSGREGLATGLVYWELVETVARLNEMLNLLSAGTLPPRLALIDDSRRLPEPYKLIRDPQIIFQGLAAAILDAILEVPLGRDSSPVLETKSLRILFLETLGLTPGEETPSSST